MSELKCPFCQQELECCGAYIYGTKKLGCANCGLTGDSKLFLELIRTRKALDIAFDEINKIKVAAESVGIGFFMTAAIFASEKIKTALEQKDVK